MQTWTFTRAVLLVLAAALLINALAFTAAATNPFIDRDEWFFLKSVVMPFSAGEFNPRDLFLMRAPSDHALPMQKLVLLASFQFADLDYHFQAFVGMFFSVVLALLLCRGILATVTPTGRADDPAIASLLALSVLFSLHATVTFSWPLVTLGYFGLCSSFLLFLAVNQAINHGPAHLFRIGMAALLALVIADDAGLLAALCSLAMLAIFAIRDRRRDLGLAFLCVGLVLFGYRILVYAELAAYANQGNEIGALRPNMRFLLQQPWDMYKALTYPFANSIMHRMHFNRFLGEWGAAGHVLFGIGILGLHVAAWWRYVRMKSYRITVVPAMLALLSYLAIIGILLVRVSANGFDYLHMPRYTRLYQIGFIGVLWMWYLCPAPDSLGVIGRTGKCVNSLLMGGLIGAATLSAVIAWTQVDSQRAWQLNYARFLVRLADTPAMEDCPKRYVVCAQSEPAQRARMLSFLRDNQLNVFRPRYQEQLASFPAPR